MPSSAAPSPDRPPFATWDVAMNASGWAMGERHAATGDPTDYSDVRCAPLEAERDAGANACGQWGTLGHAAFLGGYEDGYRSAVAP